MKSLKKNFGALVAMLSVIVVVAIGSNYISAKPEVFAQEVAKTPDAERVKIFHFPASYTWEHNDPNPVINDWLSKNRVKVTHIAQSTYGSNGETYLTVFYVSR